MKFNSRRSNTQSLNGMVATSQPLAAMAGLRILMDGGNAVDAAVATAATLAVVEPHSTGLGGDVFVLIRTSDGNITALNASGSSPAAASSSELVNKGMDYIPELSPFAVTVPGAVSGWESAINSYGTMPLPVVLKSAIEYASNGFPVSEVISSAWGNLTDKLLNHPSGATYLSEGKSPNTGQIFQIPELCNTLRSIAEGGSEAFYSGPVGNKITDFVQSLGGWLSNDDMIAHTASWEQPISTSYRDSECFQVPPNSQGINLLMALNMAENFDFSDSGYQSSNSLHHMIEIVRLALDDGLRHVTDPAHMTVSPNWLLSKSRARQRFSLIKSNSVIDNLNPYMRSSQDDTVYIAAVDGHGNACSFINSVFQGFGSGLVVPDTGIALHNRGASFSLNEEHPNCLKPSKRPYHTLMPGMVTKDGELQFCYGVMGAMQQAQGHFQVLLNMIDFGLSPQEALNAPRFSVRLGEGVAIENIANHKAIAELQNFGHPISVESPHGIYFGGGQIIQRDLDTGLLTGGSEPRLDGMAVGW